ncbi:MAG: MFS transporter [Rhodococcus sp. (in: high G+C Gram-positive bacteria)]|uniref:MFS transporter n=1 Tax=Rhodococcus sp. TaxID=1831 RepID=UPI003BB1A9DA
MSSQQIPQQRRTLAVLVGAQVLSGAGLAAGITVGALLAQDMLETTSLAGLPSAMFTIGSAAAAVTVGHISQRLGRRTGLALGYAAGSLGSLGVVGAAVLDNIALLFLALFVYGAGTATNLQARYAGADLASAHQRGRAVSTVLVATTVGAVVGPNLVTVMGDLATRWGIPALSGPFVLSAAAYALAALVLWVLLRPDPLLLARTLAADTPAPAVDETTPAERTWSPAVVLGATVMVVTQLVMVAIMTMTPIHMQHHGHSVGAAGMVIAVHVGSMYLPSPLSGLLVDRLGPRPVAAAAALTLLAAGITAAAVPASSVAALALALGLLGLGWNLGLVSGTTIITDEVPLTIRARTQGTVDLCIAVAGAGGGLTSGMIVAATDYTVLAVTGGVIALSIVPALALSARTKAKTKTASAPANETAPDAAPR